MATLSIQKVSAGQAGRGARGSAQRTTRRLTELNDADLLSIAQSWPRTSPERAGACEELVRRYSNLVTMGAQRYAGGPEPTEDLIQVGYVGLLKAINNFDPAVGTCLAAYARPCITGEIKRHFRDKRWQVHVERPLKALALEVRDATEPLTQQLGHAPSEADLASTLNASEVQIRQARLANLALQAWSLDAPLTDHPGAARLAEVLGEDDPNIEKMLNLQAVATHLGDLPRREQQILVMRFYGDMTQAQIGAKFGISQMQVSRLLAHALGYLRDQLLGLQDGTDRPRRASGTTAASRRAPTKQPAAA
jgi:RNA polymerase sigma-B factor